MVTVHIGQKPETMHNARLYIGPFVGVLAFLWQNSVQLSKIAVLHGVIFYKMGNHPLNYWWRGKTIKSIIMGNMLLTVKNSFQLLFKGGLTLKLPGLDQSKVDVSLYGNMNMTETVHTAMRYSSWKKMSPRYRERNPSCCELPYTSSHDDNTDSTTRRHIREYVLSKRSCSRHTVEELAVAVGNDEFVKQSRQANNSLIAPWSGRTTSAKSRVWLASEWLLSNGINTVTVLGGCRISKPW